MSQSKNNNKRGLPPSSKCKIFQNVRSTTTQSTVGSHKPAKENHFSTAHALFNANVPSPTKPTEQSTRDGDKQSAVEVLMPEKAKELEAHAETANNVDESMKIKDGRDMISLTGGVEFLLKVQRIHAKRNILWEVIGKQINVTKGKQPNELTIVLQSLTGGSILQVTYYHYNSQPIDYSKWNILRLVGRYVDGNRFQAYRIDCARSMDVAMKYLTKQENFLAPLFLAKNEQP